MRFRFGVLLLLLLLLEEVAAAATAPSAFSFASNSAFVGDMTFSSSAVFDKDDDGGEMTLCHCSLAPDTM